MRSGGRVAQTRISGATSKRSRRVAEPPEKPARSVGGRGRRVREREHGDAVRRCHRGRDGRRAGEPDHVLNALEGFPEREPAEQVDGHERLERVSDGDAGRDPERDAARRVAEEGADRDRRPDPRAEQEQRRDRDPGGRPDGRDDAVADRQIEAELRSTEVDGRDDGDLEDVRAWARPHGSRIVRQGALLAERREQRLLSLEGEEEEIRHPECRVVRPELRPERGVADDRVLAPFHRAVERLRHDARADAGQLAAVQLCLAEDVEPERRVGQDALPLCLGEASEIGTAVSVTKLRLGQLRDRDALALQERDHLLPGGEPDHVRPASGCGRRGSPPGP